MITAPFELVGSDLETTLTEYFPVGRVMSLDSVGIPTEALGISMVATGASLSVMPPFVAYFKSCT